MIPTQEDVDAIDKKIEKYGAVESWRRHTRPVKECPECHESVPAGEFKCPGCGFGFYHSEKRDRATRDEMNARALAERQEKLEKEIEKIENE